MPVNQYVAEFFDACAHYTSGEYRQFTETERDAFLSGIEAQARRAVLIEMANWLPLWLVNNRRRYDNEQDLALALLRRIVNPPGSEVKK